MKAKEREHEKLVTYKFRMIIREIINEQLASINDIGSSYL